jgi:hypothetical protein
MAEKKAEHVEKYDKLKKHKDNLLELTKRHHIEAYYHAVDNVLKEEDKKFPDYDKLKKGKHQLDFADKMADFYVGKAKDHFKISGDLGDLERDMLMNTYAGVTKGQLKAFLKTHGHKYKINQHKGIVDELIEEQDKKLTLSTRSHFKDEHAKELLKVSGADKYLNPDVITLEEAISVYDIYKESGTVTKEILEKTSLPKYKFKKEEKK